MNHGTDETVPPGNESAAHAPPVEFRMVENGPGEKRLFTRNLVPGRSIYGERLSRDAGTEWREWNPYRSKAAAFILSGGELPSMAGKRILYLGAATGTTVSHVSDMAGEDARIFAVEFSRHSFTRLKENLSGRENVIPILGDASGPEEYALFIPPVEIIYQDISQRDQLDIFLKNCRRFLEKNGTGILMLKLHSMDITAEPGVLLENARAALSPWFGETGVVDISGYARRHFALYGKFRKDRIRDEIRDSVYRDTSTVTPSMNSGKKQR